MYINICIYVIYICYIYIYTYINTRTYAYIFGGPDDFRALGRRIRMDPPDPAQARWPRSEAAASARKEDGNSGLVT